MTISPSEWEVMRVVWASPKSGSNHIVSALQDKQGWSVSTIKTLLARLVEKGYLQTTKSGRQFQYEALVDQSQANQDQLVGLLGKICQRQHLNLLSQVLADLPMTADDVASLEALLLSKKERIVDRVPCLCRPGQCACVGGCHG